MNKQKLVELLRRHAVDIACFGTENAKTLDHLLDEIKAGETVLKEIVGQLMRLVSVLGITVFADVDGRRLRLVEDQQVFHDGRVRRRGIPTSLSEKMKASEDIETSIARALREEIGCEDYTFLTPPLLVGVETIDSPSYPGLPTQYTKYEVAVRINSGYRPEGYREDRDQLITHFVWVPTKEVEK